MKEYIENLIPYFKHRDKVLHIAGGLIIFVFFWKIFNIHIGLIMTIIAGIGSEVLDYYNKRHVSILDILATILIPLIIYLTQIIQ